ncbi:hypothetical protein PROFUN_04462 [Planoprotostelium fungivorum]|uniref:Uncharacterized protein n=1 Tax=Planoprotostelium fungivorum TaxID=1890364 RepID=A0A2P6NVN9_9EUKA|nr:hypothetical protein PROFUN_04462 [Planoprotostelium fungivorum]
MHRPKQATALDSVPHTCELENNIEELGKFGSVWSGEIEAPPRSSRSVCGTEDNERKHGRDIEKAAPQYDSERICP